jgi:translation elongation factor EF-Tu-like GTPase
MSMDGGMPVVAAAKSGSQHPRRDHIRIAIEDVADFVWVLLLHASEVETREALGGVGVELRRWDFRRPNRAAAQKRRGRPASD